jgi:hypothetical protein
VLGEVGESERQAKEEEEDSADWIEMTEWSKGEGGKWTCGERADTESMAVKPAENGKGLGERGNGEGRPARLRMGFAEVHAGLKASTPGRVATVLDLKAMMDGCNREFVINYMFSVLLVLIFRFGSRSEKGGRARETLT